MESNSIPTILLVEDEKQLRILLKRVLEQTGYQVLSAGSVLEAVELFNQNHEKINILLSDIVLPDGRGDALAEQLHALRPELKILLISGYAEPDVLQRLKLKATFIPKPFHANRLIEAIENVLGNKVH